MKPAILSFVETVTFPRAALLGAAYVAGALVAVRARTFYLPVDMLAVAAAATFCALIARRVSRLVAPATWLARRTLPIYLLHFLLMPVLGSALEAFGSPILGSAWAGSLYPLASVPILVSCALATHALMSRLGLADWVFDLPAPRLGAWKIRSRLSPAQLSDNFVQVSEVRAAA